MDKVEDILIQMKNNPADVRFADLSKAYQVKQVLFGY
jgi:hypothetical protein